MDSSRPTSDLLSPLDKEATSHKEEKKHSAPPIHYIWIGPPSKIPGHDIGGPTAMSKVNRTNPIYFWCLEKYKVYYAEKLKKQNVIVASVEKYIEEKQTDKSTDSNATTIIKTLLDTFFNKEAGRGSIRDYVSFKVAFGVYLLQTMSGYVLDTNILPTKETELSLKAYEKLRVPVVSIPGEERQFECWMLYSPAPNDPAAKKMLEYYFEYWEDSENIRKQLLNQKQSLEFYYESMPIVVTNPIIRLYNEDAIETLNVIARKDRIYIDIEELGLRKTYNNTHKFAARSFYDPSMFKAQEQKSDIISEVFYYVLSGNIPQLRVFIENKGNINEQMKIEGTVFYENETPLNFAIRHKLPNEKIQQQMIEMLLEAGADLSLKTTYPNGKVMSTESLISNEHQKYLSLLKNSKKKGSNPGF